MRRFSSWMLSMGAHSGTLFISNPRCFISEILPPLLVSLLCTSSAHLTCSHTSIRLPFHPIGLPGARTDPVLQELPRLPLALQKARLCTMKGGMHEPGPVHSGRSLLTCLFHSVYHDLSSIPIMTLTRYRDSVTPTQNKTRCSVSSARNSTL